MRAVAFVLLCSCAASTVAPASRPVVATALPDFSPIAPGQCTPELDGMFLSYEGGGDLVRAHKRLANRVSECEIDLDAQLKMDKARAADDERLRTWAVAGPFVGAGTVALGFIIAMLVRK